jgi:transcriptional regulator NrdR family protein
MVCIYCHGNTEVTNSRPKVRNASVWRRRACTRCVAQFTTMELPDYTTALVVEGGDKAKMYPFTRDKLFLSLYRALGHRQDALNDSTALTSTVIGRIVHRKLAPGGVISIRDLARISYEVLKRFDPLAASSYKAYHQAALKT